MRLHRLELSAFVAFGGREVVDFDALGEAGLFLLQGRTGSGKTTLLDAVCFAFYGEVPGARGGDGARLRSDHAPPEVATEVTLEATLRGRRVRITRAPEQERPKLRGDGLTTEAHRVRVVAVRADGREEVLATRHDEARRELADLLGMTKDQFCQVVLLPQGGFARFLHARSDEREALLRELFDVGRFAAVEAWLKQAKHDAERAAGAALGEVRDVVARAEEAAGAAAPEDWTAEPDGIGVWLEQQLVVAEASHTTADGACATATAARDATAAALAFARELAGRQAQHAAAREALIAWEARRGERDAAAAEVAAARRAAPGAALVQALEARARTAAEAERAAAAALAEARAAGVDPPPVTQLTLGDESGESAALRAERDRLAALAGAVEAMAPRETQLQALERTVHAQQQRRDGQLAEIEARRADVAAADTGRPAAEAAVAAARDAGTALPGLEAEAARRAEAAEAGAVRDARAAELERARAGLLAARTAAVAAEEAHLRLLRRRLDGIAAELAGRLAGGEPCAVCGSTEHPAPAPAPAGGLVDDAAVRAAQEEAVERARARDGAAAEVARLEAELAARSAVAGPAPLAHLRAAAEQAAHAAAAARSAATGGAEAQRRLRELETTRERAVSRLQAAQEAVAALEAKLEEGLAALAREREAVEAARGGAPSVAARAAGLAAGAAAAARAADAVDAAARARAEADVARARASAAAREAGFAAVDALRAAVRDGGRCDALDDAVRRWDAEHADRRAAAERADLAGAAAEPAPDLAALEAAAAEAVRTAEATHGALVLARRRHEALTALRSRLEAALAACAPARKRLRVAREVADLAAGTSASNALRMRLSAYVLAARLEEVAAAASVRLAQMSGGRYALEHADDGARGNRRGGLDLRVVDAWTGRHRSPASLSGGETFLASLALALGLADVVTREAGGARLETLFVDEGFGSLDDEGTLDEVLEVLDGLRDGGRAIGVVSHVAEMRQRIPVQLRVEKGRAGSRVVQAAAAPA